MRPTALHFVVLTIIFLHGVTCSSKRAGSKACKRQVDKLEPGRTCRKQCKSDKDCRGGKKRCECDNVCGKSCFNKKASCPNPGSLDNGKITGNVLIYDATIEYVCNKGFVLDGRSTRVCQSDRKWSGSKPICAEGCPSPPRVSVSFATSDGNIFKVGASVNYKCRFGYTLVGNSSSQCLKSLKWSLPKHLCVPISCGDPGKPLNGYIEGKDFTFGKWITYRCDKGYNIDDARLVKRYCATSGRWSGQPRTCSKLKCEPPTDPVNGYVEKTSSSLEFTTVITYRCDPGYRIDGNAKGQCNEDGNWGILPICSVDVDCNFDSAPPNSFCGYTNVGVTRWRRHLLRENTVSGSPSYIIRSPGAPAVLLSPKIISKRPHCFKFYYFIKRIINRMSITITMKNGDAVFGRIWPMETTFRWLRQQLTVKANPNIGFIQYEIKINDRQTEVDMDEFSLEMGACDTNCPDGTCRNGGICVDRVGSFSCLCTRFYTGRNCEIEILCPPLPNIEYGKIIIRPNPALLKPETLASFTCVDGFKLTQGPRQVECTYEGIWGNPRIPICKEILCPTVRPPQNGGRIMITEEKDKIAIGSVVIFTCPINLYLSGGPEIKVCNRNGAWSSKPRPRCQRKNTNRRVMGCPPGYLPFDTTCYRAFTRKLNFHDAASTCGADDANLAIIRSRGERNKVSKIMITWKSYFYGATNAGYKDMRWSNKETFVKIAGLTYSNTHKRKDVTVSTRCGSMFKYANSFTFSARSCMAKFAFICQTFASKVQPIIMLAAQANLKTSVDGIYRPMIGVTYKGRPVYQRQTIPKFHLYRIVEGWEVGAFDIKHTIPFKRPYIIRSRSSASLPQDISESWYQRATESNHATDVRLDINIYDRWKTWSKWTACSRTCGRGTRKRSRKCRQEGETAGFGDCKGPSLEDESCNTKKCIRTRWRKWSNWSNCTELCGGGQTSRSRVCTRDPLGKEFCKGKRMQTKSCSTQDCRPETSKWRKSEHLQNEYKIFSLNETESNPESFCNEKGGSLANVRSTAVIDFLRKLFDDIHCKSKSVFTEWILQLDQGLQEVVELEYSGDESRDDMSSRDSNSSISGVVGKCRFIHHSCDEKRHWFSEAECNDITSSRILCQRERLPCNSDPCGVWGQCKDINETHYECDCHVDFYGTNCEHELDGCDLTLSKLPVRNATFDHLYEPITAEENYLEKGEHIFISCPKEEILVQFTCEKRNHWQPESVYEFCQS